MKRIRTQSGFTIVELIIVVAVIAILAGIVIVSYGAWRKTTTENVIKSDLKGAMTALEDARTFGTAGYPSAIPTSFSPSSTVVLTGGGRPGGVSFCIVGTATSDASIQLYVSDRQKEPAAGTCAITNTLLATLSVRVDGLAVDKSGTVYAPDGNVVKKIAPDGTVTTLAGTQGTSGNVNGPVASALFTAPRGTSMGADGAVYVADINGNAIRKISADKTTVSTFSQTSVHATDIAVGTDGNYYALEGDNFSGGLFKLSSTGVVTKIAGNATNASVDGQGLAASFHDPRGLTRTTDGSLFVCDNGTGLVRKVTPSYAVTTYAGQGVVRAGGATPAITGSCGGLAAGPRNTLYIASGARLYLVDVTTGASTQLATLTTTGAGIATNGSGDVWMTTGTTIRKISIP